MCSSDLAGAVHFHALILPDVDVGLCMYGPGPGRVESGVVADSVLIFLFRLGPVPRGSRPRARHLTREHVPLADVLPGYTKQDKVKIAQKYLVPKEIKENGLKKENIKISERAIDDIIEYYTRESGVRNLQRTIAKVYRKVAKKVMVFCKLRRLWRFSIKTKLKAAH